MVYDDFLAGKRAMDTCNFLAFQLGRGIELRTSMWKFDVLRCAKLNEMAVDDAVEADVIIVANGRDSGLPREVCAWLDAWVPRKRGRTAALLALLDFTGNDEEAPAEALSVLKRAAAGAEIDFLPQEIRPADDSAVAAESSFGSETPRRDNIEANRPSPEGWGLND
jgi:hypothetical protein